MTKVYYPFFNYTSRVFAENSLEGQKDIHRKIEILQSRIKAFESLQNDLEAPSLIKKISWVLIGIGSCGFLAAFPSYVICTILIATTAFPPALLAAASILGIIALCSFALCILSMSSEQYRFDQIEQTKGFIARDKTELHKLQSSTYSLPAPKEKTA